MDVGGHDLVPGLPAHLAVDQREVLQVQPQGGHPRQPPLPDAPGDLREPEAEVPIAVGVPEEELVDDLLLTAAIEAGKHHPLEELHPAALLSGEGRLPLLLEHRAGDHHLGGGDFPQEGDQPVRAAAVVAHEILPLPMGLSVKALIK